MGEPPAAPCIKRLEEEVVNRIAAGEVIHRPASALKELLENSLDAGATQVTVLTKQGGLKLLQIQDNGHGIRLEDLAIVCERFTTSKLRAFEDLTTIRTFGFRGEALASITHVARVAITTMTDGAGCAYRAQYSAGKLVSPDKKGAEPAQPRPCAGTRGTIISVEDLFYNMQTRRKALKSASEEYQRILEVVTRYAVGHPHCSMTCKKAEAATADVHTPKDSTALRNIALLFGQAVARELLPLEADRLAEADLAYKLDGLISSANYNSRKAIFILFINGRLVDCSALKKAVELVYASYLPKNTHPFAYLSLFIQPDRLDVNVHPTKKEVHFLNEAEVVADVHELVTRRLLGQNSARTFVPQAASLLPTPAARASPVTEAPLSSAAPPSNSSPPPAASGLGSPSPPAAAKKRSHSASLLPPAGTAAPPPVAASPGGAAPPSAKDLAYKVVRTAEQRGAMDRYVQRQNAEVHRAAGADLMALSAKRRRVTDDPDQLTSVSNVLAAADAATHSLLADLFQHGAYTGSASHRFSLAQYRTGLYVLDMCRVTRELVRQLVFWQFGRLPKFALSPGLLLEELVMVALDMDGVWAPVHGDKAAIAAKAAALLRAKAEMVAEYFSLDIDAEGRLAALPQPLPGYVPPLARLPLFVLRLATDVDWEYEQRCFETLAQELADFYAFPDVLPPEEGPPADPTPSQEAVPMSQPPEDAFASQAPTQLDPSQAPCSAASSVAAPSTPHAVLSGGTPRQLKWLLQHVVWPACRSFLAPPRAWATDGTVVQVACLENLYKVFERC